MAEGAKNRVVAASSKTVAGRMSTSMRLDVFQQPASSAGTAAPHWMQPIAECSGDENFAELPATIELHVESVDKPPYPNFVKPLRPKDLRPRTPRV